MHHKINKTTPKQTNKKIKCKNHQNHRNEIQIANFEKIKENHSLKNIKSVTNQTQLSPSSHIKKVVSFKDIKNYESVKFLKYHEFLK